MGVGNLTAAKASRGNLAPGRHADGGGLYLQVTDAGVRSWIFRYRSPIHRAGTRGRLREMGLGALEVIGLADARQAALEQRKLIVAGLDPIDERERQRAAARVAAASGMTFGECVAAYLKDHEPTWSNEKHRRQWRYSLEDLAGPVLGTLPVQAIDRPLVLKVIQPIWHKTPDTASRTRGRIEAILDWAKASGYRDGPNPAIWKDGLDAVLPAPAAVRAVVHHPALPYRDLPAFMTKLRALGGASADALELIILTVLRSSEGRGGAWPEVDDVGAPTLWSIPGARMKERRAHRVPLSSAAAAVLRRRLPDRDPRHGDLMFPGQGTGKPLSDTAVKKVLDRLAYGHVTVHGFRSAFRDWAGEQTAFPREVAEACLAHAIGDAVERAYARGDLLEKRRRLMEAWAGYCGSAPAAGNVVPINARL